LLDAVVAAARSERSVRRARYLRTERGQRRPTSAIVGSKRAAFAAGGRPGRRGR
jgi:hypothetical protein